MNEPYILDLATRQTRPYREPSALPDEALTDGLGNTIVLQRPGEVLVLPAGCGWVPAPEPAPAEDA